MEITAVQSLKAGLVLAKAIYGRTDISAKKWRYCMEILNEILEICTQEASDEDNG